MERTYYVYSHKRNDTNEIFYIGFGSKYQDKYIRSKDLRKSMRNFMWWKIYNGCKRDITIDIIFESVVKEDVLNEEIRLISLYGKMIDNNGILTNLSDGGEYNGSPSRMISQYSSDGFFIKKWKSAMDASSHYNISEKSIYSSIERNYKSCGFIWKYFTNDDSIIPYIDKSKKKVSKYTKTGEYICTYNSLAEASRDTNIDRSSINHCAIGNRKTCGGFCWSYKENKVVLPKDYIIVQYDMSMNKICEYSYFSDIMKKLNINSSTAIKNCFIGKQKQAYGFIWKKENPILAKELGLSVDRLSSD
jgi:hypothetical protein